ncbi:GNAT family N-acetyltransferase [Gammaproteobacteria bacterium]|nr:GNAT family N-acetyltransferase [Gammaproteobacteria bacterium]
MTAIKRNSIEEFSEKQFLELSSSIDSPFLQYQFLHALEKSKSVSIDNGWEPSHFTKTEKDNIVGFVPLYKKYNSSGEFVFDHSWAHALERAGRQYYPKLISAIPFTPCKGERIIGKDKVTRNELIHDIKEYMAVEAIESWHILFPDQETSSFLKNHNFIERLGCRFVWKNRNFENFENFLEIFTARQRKTIKAERKKVINSKITFKIIESLDITQSDWDIFYRLYCQTYMDRWQKPYLEKSFFNLITSASKSCKPILFFAVQDNEVIGGSLCFKNVDTLFGRHWGSIKNVDCLHFEACYYQGIEYCIKNNLHYFDPGIQGEHKIRRGFEPELSSSFHYFLKDDLDKAISDFCLKESKGILQYKKSCEEYTPIKNEYRIKS